MPLMAALDVAFRIQLMGLAAASRESEGYSLRAIHSGRTRKGSLFKDLQWETPDKAERIHHN
jgi:hypothetical protein